MAKRGAQIMPYGIGEGFQFLIDGLKLNRSFSEFLVEFAYLLLPSLALRDVVVGFEDRDGDPLLVPLQRPSAGHHHAGSIRFGFLEFAFPSACPEQTGRDVAERRRKNRPQQIVRARSDRFLRRPPVQLLSAAISVCNDVAHVTDKNRVMREIEQAGLLRSYRYFLFESVAGFEKVPFDAAADRAEPSQKRRK